MSLHDSLPLPAPTPQGLGIPIGLASSITAFDPLPLHAHSEYYLVEPITMDRAARLAQALLAEAEGAQALTTKAPITLNLCSPGGVVDGLFLLGAALQRLRALGHPIRTRIAGGAYSAAFILAQYGTHRQMDASAMGHIHTIQLGAGYGPDTLLFEDERARNERQRWLIASVLAARNTAGYTDPKWWLATYYTGREHYLTASECLRLGLIDEIVGDLDSLHPPGWQAPVLAAVPTAETGGGGPQ